MKARQENALCDGKVLGDKRGNGLSWCAEQTGPLLSLTHWSGGLATFILSSFLSFPSPRLHELASPLSLSPIGVLLKRRVCSVAQLLINMQISDLSGALVVWVQDYERDWFQKLRKQTLSLSFMLT